MWAGSSPKSIKLLIINVFFYWLIPQIVYVTPLYQYHYWLYSDRGTRIFGDTNEITFGNIQMTSLVFESGEIKGHKFFLFLFFFVLPLLLWGLWNKYCVKCNEEQCLCGQAKLIMYLYLTYMHAHYGRFVIHVWYGITCIIKYGNM